MPSQSLVIGFYLGMRSHMILVVIPHDKQRYLYSSFCFQNLFFMHDLSNFVTSITEVKITPCFYFKQKLRKNLHLIISNLFHLKLFFKLFQFSISILFFHQKLGSEKCWVIFMIFYGKMVYAYLCN